MVIPNVALPTRAGVFDLALAEGRIASLTPVDGFAEWVALPPLADLHLHASRAFTLDGPVPRDFDHAVAMVMEQAAAFGEADCARQAAKTFAQLLRKGTTRARSHADVGGPFGLKPLTGTLAAGDALRDKLDLETVAFLWPGDDAATAAGAAVLRDAVRAGADLIGAVPCRYPDPAATIDAMLDLAVELDCDVDLHLDEHLDAGNCWSEYLARGVVQRGLQGRATLGHGCAIAALDDVAKQRTIAALGEAQVTVVVLPATNLYLQDRAGRTPVRRGFAPARELIAVGVKVRIASDNIRDAFYPYGSGDLLDIAALAATALHIEAADELLPTMCGGKAGLAVGDAADFVLVRGHSLSELLAERPDERRVMRAGHEIAMR